VAFVIFLKNKKILKQFKK